MSVSTYVPSVIDENLYEQTKRDARSAFAPKNTVITSGALAGGLSVWLPALVYFPLVFLYKYFVGARVFMTGEEKMASALGWLSASLGGFARVAIWMTLALAVYGGYCAILRRKCALEDRYLKMQFARWGNMRFGTDAVITIIGVPVAICVALFIINRLDFLIVTSALILISGALYYGYWQKLQDLFLRLIFRLDFVDLATYSLRLMIPRTVGWKNARNITLEVDKEKKWARVTGEFASKDVEADARNITQHYLRGYHPVYIVNTKEQS